MNSKKQRMTVWTKRRGLVAGVAVAVGLTLAACGSDEADEHDEHPMHEHIDDSTLTAERPEDARPYGKGFEHLSNAPADEVADAALTALGEATSAETDNGSAIDRINGVVTGGLWSKISDDPSLVVPNMTGPAWRAWDSAGGTQTAEVREDSEQHPEDTDTTWTRKYGVNREQVGVTSIYRDSYIIECTKTSGQWRVSDLRLLSTTTAQG